jgi:hypothetical protein
VRGTCCSTSRCFDAKKLEALFELAERERGAVFVGVVLGRAERRFLDERTGAAAHDAAAWIVGARLRRRKRAARQSVTRASYEVTHKACVNV